MVDILIGLKNYTDQLIDFLRTQRPNSNSPFIKKPTRPLIPVKV